MKDTYTFGLGCLVGILLGLAAGAWICAEGKWSQESLCTQDGDQAREFARQCKADGGELSIYEYTCKHTNE